MPLFQHTISDLAVLKGVVRIA